MRSKLRQIIIYSCTILIISACGGPKWNDKEIVGVTNKKSELLGESVQSVASLTNTNQDLAIVCRNQNMRLLQGLAFNDLNKAIIFCSNNVRDPAHYKIFELKLVKSNDKLEVDFNTSKEIYLMEVDTLKEGEDYCQRYFDKKPDFTKDHSIEEAGYGLCITSTKNGAFIFPVKK